MINSYYYNLIIINNKYVTFCFFFSYSHMSYHVMCITCRYVSNFLALPTTTEPSRPTNSPTY